MPTHGPDLSRLSLSQLAAISGRDRRTVRKRLEGVDPVAQDGSTLWFSARAALEAWREEREAWEAQTKSNFLDMEEELREAKEALEEALAAGGADDDEKAALEAKLAETEFVWNYVYSVYSKLKRIFSNF